MWAHTVPTPGAPTPGETKDSTNYERNIKLDVAHTAGVAKASIKPDTQALFDSGQEPPKRETLSGPAALVKSASSPDPIHREVEVGGIAPIMGR